MATRYIYRQQPNFTAVAFGVIAGIIFAGYMLKAPAAAVPAAPAVVALDYSAITAAVKAGFPAAAPAAVAAAPAVAPAAPAAAAPAVKRKIVKRRAAPRPAVYIVRYAAPTCSCMF